MRWLWRKFEIGWEVDLAQNDFKMQSEKALRSCMVQWQLELCYGPVALSKMLERRGLRVGFDGNVALERTFFRLLDVSATP